MTAVHSDPSLAQLLANGVASQFFRSRLKIRVEPPGGQRFALIEEVDRLKSRLGASERKVQSYREHNKSVSLRNG